MLKSRSEVPTGMACHVSYCQRQSASSFAYFKAVELTYAKRILKYESTSSIWEKQMRLCNFWFLMWSVNLEGMF